MSIKTTNKTSQVTTLSQSAITNTYPASHGMEYPFGQFRIIESWNPLSWKGPLEATWCNLPAMSRDIHSPIRVK